MGGGGQQSPRQKMINMMYLVLTALLAMNVSAEILAAFETIREKLESSAGAAGENNKAFIENMKLAIQKEISDEGQRRNEGLLKDTLDRIAKKRDEMLGIINKYSEEMEKIGGVDPVTGKIVNKSETEKNYQYWMGVGDKENANNGRGAGQAYELKESLDAYTKWIVEMHNKQLRTPEAKKNELKLDELILTKDPDEKESKAGQGGVKKTWELHTFEGPVVANLATLASLKTDVFRMEKKLLDLLNTRLGVATFKVDKVVAIDAPTATIVPAGLQFQTRLYVAMSSTQIKPKFSGSGSIKPSEDGNSATMSIGANGSVIPKGSNEGTQTYTATVQVPKATGGFENLQVTGKFTVRKPEIVITSASVQNLYRNCGNKINIDVPALGDAYNPAVTASEASVQGSKENKKTWLIVPTGKACDVNVKSNTNGQTLDIGTVAYKVIEPPKPTIMMKANSLPYNGSSPISKNSNIGISLIPDQEFKAALPQDARYEIGSIDVLGQLSLGPPKRVGGVTCQGQDATQDIKITLGPEIRQAGAGTKVYIKVNKIYRKNFQGKVIEDTRFPEIELTKSLVTKD